MGKMQANFFNTKSVIDQMIDLLIEIVNSQSNPNKEFLFFYIDAHFKLTLFFP